MDVVRKRTKQILLDILGVLLLLGSLLLLPIPGPGAFPVFLAGLSILSINHHWARRLLKRVRKEGSQMIQKIFIADPKIMLVLDIFGLLGITVAIYGLIFSAGYVRIGSFSLGVIGISTILYNRQRYQKIKFIKKH